VDGFWGAVVGGIAGYLLGTFPTAVVVTRLATHGAVDIRAAGSGNPGGLNTAQVVGKKWGAVVMLLDAGKGLAGGLVGWAIGGDAGAYAGATTAIAGHIFPVWTGFRKGGKGVATSAGSVLAVFPIFFPLDTAVAAAGALGVRNAERAMQFSCPVWVVAGLVWWLADLPNLWGPDPSWGLFAFSVAGSALILGKFALSPRPAPRRGTG
jgi:acyl-phosphate glycerol 3-phosphate acyltransferase